MPGLRRLSVLAAALCLAGCAGYGRERVRYPSVSPETHVVVSGEVLYRERVALPPGAALFFELRPEEGGAPLRWKRSVTTAGPPLAFEIAAARDALRPGTAYLLTAEIRAPGMPPWTTPAAVLRPGAAPVDLGTLTARRGPPEAD